MLGSTCWGLGWGLRASLGVKCQCELVEDMNCNGMKKEVKKKKKKREIKQRLLEAGVRYKLLYDMK